MLTALNGWNYLKSAESAFIPKDLFGFYFVLRGGVKKKKKVAQSHPLCCHCCGFTDEDKWLKQPTSQQSSH